MQIELMAHQHRELRRRLLAEDPDLDDQTLADTLEGLTDLNDMLAALIRAALTDEALANGLKGRIEDMRARLSRLQDRAGKRRAIARDVMVQSEIKTITAPDLTLSIRPGVPSLVLVDESAIPQPYWQPQPSKLDRRSLLDELKHGCTVPGVALSNPEPVLSVRSR